MSSIKNLGIFGLPNTQTAETIILPVPWEVTVSYNEGTALGPLSVLKASPQLDLFHPHFPELIQRGISMLDIPEKYVKLNNTYRKKALSLIEKLNTGQTFSEEYTQCQKDINTQCGHVMDWVYETSSSILKEGKLLALLGGDHSTPLGYLKALADIFPSFGILHIDSHMDLRLTYEGFTYSHASIMRHAMDIPEITRLVQVGIRDYCEEEYQMVQQSKGRIKLISNMEIQEQLFQGKSFDALCKKMIHALPDHVYVSFDIDALHAYYCPKTGTPVPGGLSFDQIMYLLSVLAKSKKQIIGVDLVEVGHAEWDGNVGARALFHLCGYMMASEK